MEESQQVAGDTHRGWVAVVVPAAGSGSRMGGIPKQFRVLGDAPVLVQTLRAFAGVEDVAAIVVAVAESDVSEVERLLTEYNIHAKVVAGGATRQDSVWEGLRAVGDLADVVLVHDAARPFISRGQIREVIAVIHEHGAAAVAVPVADTLRRSSFGVFNETVDRDDLFRMLTPQGARVDVLVEAHKHAAAEGFAATDEVELLQRVHVDVRLVVGDERNIKLTRPSDCALANALWAEWKKMEK